jgi:hypothetical protein
MPGVTEIARAEEIMGKTAAARVPAVEAGPAPKEELLKQYNGNPCPGEMEILPGSAQDAFF